MDSDLLTNMNQKEVGQAGENEVARHLVAQGVRILTRNFRYSKNAEIDIVALTPDNTLCFVEVKTRKASQSWSAVDSIDEIKQEKLELCGEWFLQQYTGPCEGCRFDAAFVLTEDDGKMKVDYMENIF